MAPKAVRLSAVHIFSYYEFMKLCSIHHCMSLCLINPSQLALCSRCPYVHLHHGLLARYVCPRVQEIKSGCHRQRVCVVLFTCRGGRTKAKFCVNCPSCSLPFGGQLRDEVVARPADTEQLGSACGPEKQCYSSRFRQGRRQTQA